MTQSGDKGVRLKDKTIIITGGGYGIGRAFCLGLAAHGARIVIADIAPAAAEAVVKEIEAKGGEAMALEVDVSKVEDTLEMACKTAERFNRIDVLINNAAMAGRSDIYGIPFNEVDMAVWDRVIAVNLTGPFLCIRAVFPYMEKQKSGKIINITSSTFFEGAALLSHYVASKGGLMGLSRSLSTELGEYNININCISPGLTLSAPPEDRDELSAFDHMKNMRAFRRDEYPEDLVGAAVFFSSSDSDFITGQTLVVDGGFVKH